MQQGRINLKRPYLSKSMYEILEKVQSVNSTVALGMVYRLDSGAADNDKGKMFKIPPHVRFKDRHISYKR